MTPRGLPLRTGALYALGDVGPSGTLLCVSFYWLYFLIAIVGLPAVQAGALHGSGFAVSAVANLWAGRLLDRHAPTAGARLRVVAWLGVAMAAAFAALWLVVPLAPWTAAAYAVLWWSFHVLFALVYLAYVSVTPLLADTAAQRVALNAWRFALTMLLAVVLLALYAASDGRWPERVRLQAFGLTVAGLAALGSVASGVGLGRLVGSRSMEVPAVPVAWSAVARSRVLWWAVGANLAVYTVAQVVLVLTAFLTAAARLPSGGPLLLLQVAVVTGTAAVGGMAARWGADRVLAASAVLWCAGAVLWWQALAPWGAVVLLGLGLGGATVLSWARLPEALDLYAQRSGHRVDARGYVGVTLLRDLVAGGVPVICALALDGHAVGSAESGRAAAATLLATAVAAAAVLRLLPGPSRPRAAGAGTTGAPR